MDILADLSAVQSRIAEITGAPPSGPDATPAGFRDALSRATGAGVPDETPVASLPPAPVAPEQINALVSQNAENWQLDPALVKAVIANESGFNANATSPAGAQGLMQLMPETAASVGVRNPYDPAQNVAGGTRYLKGLLDRFNGDVRLAVAAYNAGPNAVEKYGDVPPYAETKNYVQNVLGSYDRYRATP
jgi:soluble lytic murein transglycosylase-like protein